MKHLLVIILSGLLIALPSCKYFKRGALFSKKNQNPSIMKAREDSTRAANSLLKIKDHLQDVENAKLDSLKRVDVERKASEAVRPASILVNESSFGFSIS